MVTPRQFGLILWQRRLTLRCDILPLLLHLFKPFQFQPHEFQSVHRRGDSPVHVKVPLIILVQIKLNLATVPSSRHIERPQLGQLLQKAVIPQRGGGVLPVAVINLFPRPNIAACQDLEVAEDLRPNESVAPPVTVAMVVHVVVRDHGGAVLPLFTARNAARPHDHKEGRVPPQRVVVRVAAAERFPPRHVALAVDGGQAVVPDYSVKEGQAGAGPRVGKADPIALVVEHLDIGAVSRPSLLPQGHLPVERPGGAALIRRVALRAIGDDVLGPREVQEQRAPGYILGGKHAPERGRVDGNFVTDDLAVVDVPSP
mmetsp:Transcript_52917/g.158410  ORF Transcript_52917/g.158410 Transcript_52917/m.158410 type:complete len:314 (+) Transcript_52917:625-1566(+)